MRKCCLLLCFILGLLNVSAQNGSQKLWWKQNNLRVIQANLPDYKAATLNPDSLVEDLMACSANTLIINAGGIMAFYPTKLDFEYTNPYLKPNNMLGNVVAKCHQHGIKVIVRFDFSRVHESIFKAHPDWCYISPKGERIINTDMYAVSINAPYVQQHAFQIISEVMDKYPVDGIFLNMPGYQVNNSYEGKYLGIDQNEYDKKRFADYSKGMVLPKEENKADPVYQKYLEFKKFTGDDWSKRLYDLVKAKNPQIAICTYTDKYVDIIRHESQANSSLPYWPYTASDNVNNAAHSYPTHIISNASIQQISFQSRYNAVEPQEVAIRLYENIANGSGLDMSMMGDMRGYEDERNFDVIKKIYGLHKKYESYFGNYTSVAKVALIAPGLWPSGLPMQEYRGIQLILKEAHIPFDIIVDEQIQNLPDKIKAYKLLILPDITYLNTKAIDVLKDAAEHGSNIIATNTALNDNPEALMNLFGAKITTKDYDGGGNYLSIDNKTTFKRLSKQTMVFLKFNLGLYDLSAADERFLPILSKGRPGPPEIIGGHKPTGNYGMAIKKHGASSAVLMPFNIGRLYYQNGYEEHKNIFLDVIDRIYPQAAQQIITNAPARVEVLLQQYGKNNAVNRSKKDGLILHLINLTGFSGATYFDPLPLYNLTFKIKSDFKPTKLVTMTTQQPINFLWKDGYVSFTVKNLNEFNSILINK
ncbi:alpha-amylase family protein [Mucilaginibacter polytrichastri]|uniref:Beta-galactosidase trimerisation domain-containing protein n=1 Tax=Mucilaginibacter polytrichastri TaxID=1302689 RepID=A0A1Q5ZZI6_9SPHI|nr:alpha-amylase family protein [Mucilaginibacter polytrichastri]OKS87159.1 hypothetical protein RG47T_2618 [Mucilaginibacter polytrichastri]SFS88227.1 Hypothetical glycosyl hydrolase 6 [Mucilaginibacter polytrichastri]